MSCGISNHLPDQLPAVLTEAGQYAFLLQRYRFHAQNGGLPPLATRVRFKRIEARLPSQIAAYLNLLLHHGSNPVTSMDRKGRCFICKQAVHPEWIESVAQGEVIYLCGGCNAIFVPPSKTTKELQ